MQHGQKNLQFLPILDSKRFEDIENTHQKFFGPWAFNLLYLCSLCTFF